MFLGWDGGNWDDLFLGGLLLSLSLEDFLEEFLVLLLSTFVLGRVLLVAVASSTDDTESNDGNDNNRSSTTGLLGKIESAFGKIESGFFSIQI